MIKNRILKLWSLAVLVFLFTANNLLAQQIKKEFAPINTAVPSLSIAPDARGGGMGDNGVATLPDVNSQYWNPAKYVFNYSQAGVSLSYTPWLRKLVNDVALVNLSGYYKLGSDDRQAIGASLRYFSFGEVQNNDEQSGATLMTLNPYEMALDVSYSRKLSDAFSMAVALRYIRSDQGADPSAEMVPGIWNVTSSWARQKLCGALVSTSLISVQRSHTMVVEQTSSYQQNWPSVQVCCTRLTTITKSEPTWT